jgi:multidrug transporter EmrE-like cation transporter
MIASWAWLGTALLATATGQLVFKQASMRRSLVLTVLAVAAFGMATLSNFFALHGLSIATVYVSTAFSQLIVVMFSLLIFRERYSFRQWAGLGLILVGVIVFNSSAFS